MKNRLRQIITWSGLPNVITLTRLLAIPVITVTLTLCGQGASAFLNGVVATVYLVAALSDLLDGYLARTYGHESNLGRFLDPLADKLLASSAIIMLIPLGRMPAWVAFLIVAREIAVTALRAIAMEQEMVIAASPQGKQKTLAQNMALFCLLWNGQLLWADTLAVGSVMLYVALAITYWSAFLYFRDFFRAAKIRPTEVAPNRPAICLETQAPERQATNDEEIKLEETEPREAQAEPTPPDSQSLNI
ncbi:MAG: CDP-diacylglycerol--glycerol-3-phosphate 3-phosphatidyltransferase [Deltaproteobacteria bacterium]|jgi:CDP-diacylglycerol--glycerol-3-phosphate 3-phosphatidyltransferase|nr:CDP-diacylglycerol--glycerol-3-phosphate 3-phosphatidyltransferase [Deltaproteobacteria bacterium]